MIFCHDIGSVKYISYIRLMRKEISKFQQKLKNYYLTEVTEQVQLQLLGFGAGLFRSYFGKNVKVNDFPFSGE